MVFVQQKQAAKEFANHRKNKWDEKQETQKFWNGLLQEIFWVKANDIKNVIDYEKTVKIDTTKFIDWYINDTKVLIEQKSCDVDLNKAEKQSDWAEFTPYQQAKRYADNLPHSENPRRIITCNFQEFHIHDMEKQKPWDNPEIVYLKDLEKEYHRLWFIVDPWDENIKKEMELSIKAWEIVWKLYDELAPLYKDITNPKSQKSLNILCVRIVFCLYAEDAWVFGRKNLFHDYLAHYSAEDMREALIRLFQVLDQKDGERDQYLKDELKAFPYVNWWLFADEDIEIPMMNEKVKNLILKQASEDFDRSEISPTIFGAVFESTLNPETRRSGGMHYTSIENIHKVIDPLFLDNLNEELEHILTLSKWYEILKQWKELQDKISNLTFLDPACGSGNFLTETYLSLRKIENKIIEKEWKWQARLINPIKVNINQFYGIEINDFAVSVAKTALRIAESQMMNETENILWESLDFLPLKTNANIVEGNALRMDWNDVVKKENLNYIMGNPPFIGYKEKDEEQKKDLENTCLNLKWETIKNTGSLDYVSGRYYKSTNYIKWTSIKCCFVSTSSITQGEQVAIMRKPLFDDFNININFAYRSFVWDSEANNKAKVHCVIICFSLSKNKHNYLFDEHWVKKSEHINPYLVDAPNVWIVSRRTPIQKDVKNILLWVHIFDDHNFIFTEEEKNLFIENEPLSKDFFKERISASDFLYNKRRFYLDLEKCSPHQLKNMPLALERIKKVIEYRKNNKTSKWTSLEDSPFIVKQWWKADKNYIWIPNTSSYKRKYLPIMFFDEKTVITMPDLALPWWDFYDFWIISSSVHMVWIKNVCWRLKSDYRYANWIVYNNFPRPTPTDEQKKKIEQTAQAILDARNLYPDSSLADLYDELTMPIELRKAHQENDKAVMEAYWFSTKMSESDIVSRLMEMYQELVK
mgnify:CR=1 FL=1